MQNQQIRISAQAEYSVLPSDLEDFQGNLKSLSRDNYEKLKRNIIEHGFAEPITCWKFRNQIFVLNGHQRLRTVIEMMKEGFQVPADGLPVVFVKAKSKTAAKRLLLSLTSNYGKMEAEGLYEFVHEAEIPPQDLLGLYDLPINTSSFVKGWFEGDEDPDESGDDSANKEPRDKDAENRTQSEVDHHMGFDTAIDRDEISAPMATFESKGWLKGDVLDFGCGMDKHNHARYDPCYRFEPVLLTPQTWDVVTCNYVLNVQPHVGARVNTLMAIRSLMKQKGKALISIKTGKEKGQAIDTGRGIQFYQDPEAWEMELAYIFGKVTKLRTKFLAFKVEL